MVYDSVVQVDLSGRDLQDIVDALRPWATHRSPFVCPEDELYAERCRLLYNSLADRLAQFDVLPTPFVDDADE